MTPYVEGQSRLRGNFAALRALLKGEYDVNLNDFVDKITSSSTEMPEAVVAWVDERATMAQIRNLVASNQESVEALTEIVENEVADAVGCNDVLEEIASYTKWRLGFDLVISSLFGGIGLVCLIKRHKLAGCVGILASLTHALAFLDELDIRRQELDDQYDNLSSVCKTLASDIVRLGLRCNNHNFLANVMQERFGKSFTSKNPTVDDLTETYDPDAEPLTYDSQPQ